MTRSQVSAATAWARDSTQGRLGPYQGPSLAWLYGWVCGGRVRKGGILVLLKSDAAGLYPELPPIGSARERGQQALGLSNGSRLGLYQEFVPVVEQKLVPIVEPDPG